MTDEEMVLLKCCVISKLNECSNSDDWALHSLYSLLYNIDRDDAVDLGKMTEEEIAERDTEIVYKLTDLYHKIGDCEKAFGGYMLV